MDHQTEHPLNRHAEKALSSLGDLNSSTTEGHSRTGGGRVEDLGVRSGGDNPTPGVLIPMLRRQTHRNVGAPLASTVIFSPSEVSIGQGDLHPPSMPGEVDLCPLDFSPHLLETESLERKLEPVGVGDFGATPYGSGLVLHDGQWAIICALDDITTPGQPKAL
jgi:hypothetical protein